LRQARGWKRFGIGGRCRTDQYRPFTCSVWYWDDGASMLVTSTVTSPLEKQDSISNILSVFL
jgi:hypothetical protein